ncbi:MAG: hypothetical protein ACI9TH_004663 [Kiritimatiellia bacterium]|jgi:hypothetical protein
MKVLPKAIFYYLFIPLSGALLAGPTFEIKQLALDGNEGVAIADVNQDGKLDVVAGRNWFEAPEFLPRPVRSIEDWNGYVESNCDFVEDLNGDGFPDVLSGSFVGTEVHWYENPGKEPLALGKMWKKHLLVDTGYSQNEGTLMHDLDGDGRREWISNSWNQKNPQLVWTFGSAEQEVLQKIGKMEVKKMVSMPTLVKHVISEDVNGHGMGFGDINNDGREDIIFGQGWFERPAENALGQTWTLHKDWPYLHGSVPVFVRDLNGDGINDLIWGKGHDYGLFWWESQGIVDGKFTWKEHEIDRSYSQPHTLHFADLDGDGVDELITGKRFHAHNGKDPGGQERPCLYAYTWDAKSRSFSRSVINEGRVGCGLQIATADLNGDGKLDIAVAGKSGTYICFNQ